MTNLEWLAKMPKEEAKKVLNDYCPFADTCSHCFYEVEGTCQRIRYAAQTMGEWLLEKREERDAKNN